MTRKINQKSGFKATNRAPAVSSGQKCQKQPKWGRRGQKPPKSGQKRPKEIKCEQMLAKMAKSGLRCFRVRGVVGYMVFLLAHAPSMADYLPIGADQGATKATMAGQSTKWEVTMGACPGGGVDMRRPGCRLPVCLGASPLPELRVVVQRHKASGTAPSNMSYCWWLGSTEQHGGVDLCQWLFKLLRLAYLAPRKKVGLGSVPVQIISWVNVQCMTLEALWCCGLLRLVLPFPVFLFLARHSYHI